VYLFFASGFTTSRAQLMNSCAAGFRVRFFKVTIPIGLGLTGKFTGSTLNDERMAPKCTPLSYFNLEPTGGPKIRAPTSVLLFGVPAPQAPVKYANKLSARIKRMSGIADARIQQAFSGRP
jgi:hypothetical protein